MSTIERITGLIPKRFNSDADFERAIGLKPLTVADWKRGKSKTYYKMISDIARALETTSAYLLCESDDPFRSSDLDNLSLKNGIVEELSEEEGDLLKLFRSLSKRDKEHVMWLMKKL